jgi:hypothetical protein
MFLTQKETVYTTATPIDNNNYGDPYDSDNGNNGNGIFQNNRPTRGFFAEVGNWMAPSATRTSSVNTAELVSSLAAMKSSMSAQSASLSSVSAMAYFSSIAASLSAREASLAAQMTATANYDSSGSRYRWR